MALLKIIPQDEIKRIKEEKLTYSIYKYEEQAEGFQEARKEAYQNALRLNNRNLTEEDYYKSIDFLDEELKKVKQIRDDNQELLDDLTKEEVSRIPAIFEPEDTDIIKCARLFQYVTKKVKISNDTIDYDDKIPFGNDHRFECYNGIPMGKNFSNLLITGEGTGADITALLVYLGNVFDLNIKSVPIKRNDKTYYINSFETNGQISYLDPIGLMSGRGDSSTCCLVDRSTLIKEGLTFGENMEQGIKHTIKMNHSSNVDKLLSVERNMNIKLFEEEQEIKKK